MKKKLLCGILAVVMLLPMLFGCSSSTSESDAIENTQSDTARDTRVITIWGLTEKETTDDAITQVAAAMSKITKAKYKTQIVLKLFKSEAEYYAALEEKFKATQDAIDAEEAEKKRLKEEAKEAKKRGETTTTTKETETVVTQEETVLNEYGISELKYPSLTDNQVDIFLITNYEKYQEYIEADLLSRLDDELTSTSKKLKDYIYPTLLNAVKYNSSTYAIPNNKALGEVTYMLVRKDLVAKYSYDADSILAITDTEDFLDTVAKYEPTVAPVLSEISPLYFKYWTYDSSVDRSIVGSYIGKAATLGTRASFRDVFVTRQYTSQMLFLKKLEESKYYSTNPTKDLADRNFAMAVMKGTPEIEDTYGDDYYVVAVDYPMATQDELFDGIFAVSTYTKELKRAMEIVTYINTNSELRNIFQYGIENVNYRIDEDTDRLVRINHDYMMNINYTGNTYLAYPEEGANVKVWEYAKKQNLMSRIDPFMGFTFDGTGVDVELMKRVDTLSKEYFAKMDACKTVEELQAFFDTASTELAANEDVIAFLDFQNSTTSPHYIYSDWFTTNWPSSDAG